MATLVENLALQNCEYKITGTIFKQFWEGTVAKHDKYKAINIKIITKSFQTKK